MDTTNRIKNILSDITNEQVEELATQLIKYIELKSVDEKVINFLNSLKSDAGRKALLNKIEDYVFNSENLEDICCLAFVDGINLTTITDIAVASKNSSHLVELARAIESLCLPNEKYTKKLIIKLQNALIDLSCADKLYTLALYSEYCDIKKIEAALIEIGDTKILEMFAANVAGAHISKIKKVIKEIAGYTPDIVKVKNAPDTKSILDPK